MSRLGSYKGDRVVKTFEQAGWEIARQRSSHVILEKEGYEATLSVPVHLMPDLSYLHSLFKFPIINFVLQKKPLRLSASARD